MLHSSGECARGEARGGNRDCCPHALGEGDNSPAHSRESRRSCPTAAQRGGGGEEEKARLQKGGEENGAVKHNRTQSHARGRGGTTKAPTHSAQRPSPRFKKEGEWMKKGRCGGKQKRGERERVNVCSTHLFICLSCWEAISGPPPSRLLKPLRCPWSRSRNKKKERANQRPITC